ncbi:hypothetical protein [Desulforhabdus sp. TSK]|uniref:hypothetical protein n=1 Tax=Desulforhabdus sp. TSK TaxID=2925014 RepID=UPI001FC81DC8|nr:hypothetical protein [Desulforhabdus sp. TSK]GKT07906.1 hypothetical protein DSTSK_12110 [Desulforhabdus sp. TSK]
MKQGWLSNASATLVGSMPHKDRSKVIELILDGVPEIPVWPQLPNFQPEQMLVQYIEGLPGLSIRNDSIYVNTDAPAFDDELYAFYEEYMEVEGGSKNLDDSRFKFGEETGKTFFQFLGALRSKTPAPRAVKGQVVGPFTLLTSLKDPRDRPALYDERLQDAVPKHLAMKARWQIQQLKSLGLPIIVFLDEPALAGFGSSAFISVSRELIQQLLKEIVDAIHEAGALVGIHVCANTDWLLMFQSHVNIINLDAYNYFDKFALYRNDFLKFMEGGGIVAWGMVPTSEPEAILQETAESLSERWLREIQPLVAPGLPLQKILSQSLFTPSCGCGSLPEPLAEKVIQLTGSLSKIMKNRL